MWLNLADDHLDRHREPAGVRRAKARIFANQVPSDWAVVNADDAAVVAHSGQTFADARVVLAVGRRQRRLRRRRRLDRPAGRRRPSSALVPVAAVELPGRHMLDNVVAATAAANLAGAGAGAIEQALRGFPGSST